MRIPTTGHLASSTTYRRSSTRYSTCFEGHKTGKCQLRQLTLG
jgi:hypothetical protein